MMTEIGSYKSITSAGVRVHAVVTLLVSHQLLKYPDCTQDTVQSIV